LKLKCDETLSNFAFNFNLRRYTVAARKGMMLTGGYVVLLYLMVGRCRFESIKTRVQSAAGVCNQRLELKCDEVLSNFAFNFNLRRYLMASVFAWLLLIAQAHLAAACGEKCSRRLFSRAIEWKDLSSYKV
jgi:dsRNA-specific ribonuclease